MKDKYLPCKLPKLEGLKETGRVNREKEVCVGFNGAGFSWVGLSVAEFSWVGLNVAEFSWVGLSVAGFS